MKGWTSRFYLKAKYGLAFNKPLYMIRLVRNFMRMFLFRKTPLRGVDFAINYRCNLRCEHCFAQRLAKKNAKCMSVEDYKRVAKEAMRLGNIVFSFQGGEIFLYKDYEEIIKACKPRLNRIAITTNGTLIDEEKIRELKELRVDSINVSIDSAIPEEHDAFRGVRGAYEKAIRAVEIALANNMNVSINTTVSHKSLYSEGLEELLKFSAERKLLINTLFAAPSGGWEGNQDILLTDEDIEYYNHLREQYPLVTRDIDTNYRERGCGAVKEIFYITPYGDVLACPFMHISLGNILEESLGQIRERALRIRYFDHYSPKCLIAECRDFVKMYLSRIEDKEQLPISYNDGWACHASDFNRK